jgi:hypothetical protein
MELETGDSSAKRKDNTTHSPVAKRSRVELKVIPPKEPKLKLTLQKQRIVKEEPLQQTKQILAQMHFADGQRELVLGLNS